MVKRITSLLLCLLLLAGSVLPVSAAQKNKKKEEPKPDPVINMTVRNATELLTLAENCRLDSYSKHLSVKLTADIDLSGTDFESIPIFCGKFDGNGHTISGLNLSADGSVQGLFRYLENGAVVQNLSVQGNIHPGGSHSQVGGIAGENAGSILNCRFRGSISGADRIGGIVGLNQVSGVIENCSTIGDLHGDHFVGGIAGENLGVIRSCTNEARVNTTPQQNRVEISDITLDTLTSSESVNTVTNIGGIAGSSSGVIRSCENKANVGYTSMGYNVGGIAGTQIGYIVDCRNYGEIQGRKEVGGIVGQMEPATEIEYKEDTLQILKKQLNTMTGLVNKASSNAQSNAGDIGGYLEAMQDHADTAKNALEALIPDSDNIIPDSDAIAAAQNALSNSLGKISQSANGIAYATQKTINKLGSDLQAISNQISAMGKTIDAAAENLGGSITDVSDKDAEGLYTGKVENAVNYGSVLADLNAGGIAGALAAENDLDFWEEWEQYGEESMNIHSKVRAVILNCENQATVTGKRQHIGGIAGWQSMGLVKNSINTGKVDAEGADYVGGISGFSAGFLRDCSAKCEVSGSAYVAGIAGSGTIATGNRAMVRLLNAAEKKGAILGIAEEASTEEEEEVPVHNNLYLPVEKDPGAIDGISYEGAAQPMEKDSFLNLENLNEVFQTVVIRFLYPDGKVKELSLQPGGSLNPMKIPVVPRVEGQTGVWEGLADADLDNVLFDMTFELSYTAYRSTIQSDAARDNGLPVLLAEGSFREDSTVSVELSEETVSVAADQTLLEVWNFQMTQPGKRMRLLLPKDVSPEAVSILIRSEENDWETADAVCDGSYLVFETNLARGSFALVQTAQNNTLMLAGAAGIALILGFLVMKKKRANK